jgi:hypothetical protein
MAEAMRRVRCFPVALYGFAVFGYNTAALAGQFAEVTVTSISF